MRARGSRRPAADPARLAAEVSIASIAAGRPGAGQVASAALAAAATEADRSLLAGSGTPSSGAHGPAVSGQGSAASSIPSPSLSRSSGGAARRLIENGPNGPTVVQLPTWSQVPWESVLAAPSVEPPATVVRSTKPEPAASPEPPSDAEQEHDDVGFHTAATAGTPSQDTAGPRRSIRTGPSGPAVAQLPARSQT